MDAVKAKQLAEAVTRRDGFIDKAQNLSKGIAERERAVSLEKSAKNLSSAQESNLNARTTKERFSFLGFLFKDSFPFAHYFAIFLFIIFLIVLFTWSSRRSSSGGNHRVQLLKTSLMPMSGDIQGDARPTVEGRCNMTSWRQTGSGLCASTTNPKPIVWIVDTLPEWSKLSTSVLANLTNQGKRTRITIPWMQKGTLFIPNIAAAQYDDGTSAADLFLDNADTVRLNEKPRTAYDVADNKYRPKKESDWYKGVSVYATTADPKC